MICLSFTNFVCVWWEIFKVDFVVENVFVGLTFLN